MRLSEIKYQTGYTTDPRFTAPVKPVEDIEDASADDDTALVTSSSESALVDAKDALSSPSTYGFIIPGSTSSGRWSLTPIDRFCPPGDSKCAPKRPHHGVDFNTTGGDAGREIIAPADGTITLAREDGSCGNAIIINHGDKGSTRCCHLQGFASGIAVNVPVTAGKVIGYVGSTGRSSGPHLHFEAKDSSGKYVNPIEWLRTNAVYFPLHSVK